MKEKTKNRALTALFLCTAVVGTALFTKTTVAQSNTNTLSGVFGCTMRDDRWGRTPQANNEYDVSGLIWILDATNKKISGMDFRYSFNNTNGGYGSISHKEPKIYKDEPAPIEATELMNVYKLIGDGDGDLYLMATNGGNTLLVSSAGSNDLVSQSGICQKM